MSILLAGAINGILPRGAHGDEGEGGGHGSEGDVAVANRTELKEPPNFAVVLHNDDYTTMEFVVEVLQRFFRKTGEEATRIMLCVHQQGKGVAGIYSHEIAETKAMQVIEYARSRNYPLMCTVEPL